MLPLLGKIAVLAVIGIVVWAFWASLRDSAVPGVKKDTRHPSR